MRADTGWYCFAVAHLLLLRSETPRYIDTPTMNVPELRASLGSLPAGPASDCTAEELELASGLRGQQA